MEMGCDCRQYAPPIFMLPDKRDRPDAVRLADIRTVEIFVTITYIYEVIFKIEGMIMVPNRALAC